MPKSRILVIDDEAAIRDSLRMTLGYEGMSSSARPPVRKDSRSSSGKTTTSSCST
jgi:DNA-binding NtrC family response regulator